MTLNRPFGAGGWKGTLFPLEKGKMDKKNWMPRLLNDGLTLCSGRDVQCIVSQQAFSFFVIRPCS